MASAPRVGLEPWPEVDYVFGEREGVIENLVHVQWVIFYSDA